MIRSTPSRARVRSVYTLVKKLSVATFLKTRFGQTSKRARRAVSSAPRARVVMSADKNERELTALARESGNKTCFSCVGPGSLVRLAMNLLVETARDTRWRGVGDTRARSARAYDARGDARAVGRAMEVVGETNLRTRVNARRRLVRCASRSASSCARGAQASFGTSTSG